MSLHIEHEQFFVDDVNVQIYPDKQSIGQAAAGGDEGSRRCR